MNIYQAAVRDIRDERRRDCDRGIMLWQKLTEEHEALDAAYREYTAEMIKAARGDANALAEKTDALKREMQKLSLNREMFEPPFRCSICRDTGYADGKYCRCAIKRAVRADAENLTLPLIDFNRAKSTAPTRTIAKAYAEAEKYIAGFDGGKPFLILTGSPGTGKTYLAAATATALMERGAAAVTIGAFEFVRRALEFHTQFSVPDYTDRFTPMLDCELLVVDDLGTENILKNVTREYLYTVVNERWRHRRYTIVTTNLDGAGLSARYGESITSRLFDKSLAAVYRLNTKNARLSE